MFTGAVGRAALQHLRAELLGVMGESSAGAMSKMVRQPVSPAQAMRQQARAHATSTLPVNSGLESSFSEYSITWVFSPAAPWCRCG